MTTSSTPVGGRAQGRATATTIREELLHDSYHVATLDNDAPRIFTGSVEFFAALAAASQVGG